MGGMRWSSIRKIKTRPRQFRRGSLKRILFRSALIKKAPSGEKLCKVWWKMNEKRLDVLF
jgi:hypothetical protein